MNKNELRFLLKEKYGFSELVVGDFLNSKIQLDDKLINEFNKKNNFKYSISDVQNDIDMLFKGYPLSYLIGYVDFLDASIDLRYKPLIPRPETEYWADKALLVIKDNLNKSKNLNVLDIFCGSGCIGIAALIRVPNINVTFSDLSGDAIRQTKYNLKLNNIDFNRYEIIKSDIFSNLNGEFDIIFANPPYVGINNEVGKEVFNEPSMAIFGGNTGMEIINKFIADFKNHIRNDTKVFMEFGEDQKGEIKMLTDHLGFKTTFHKDQNNKWRWVTIFN